MYEFKCQISMGLNVKLVQVKNQNCETNTGQNCQNDVGYNAKLVRIKNVKLLWVEMGFHVQKIGEKFSLSFWTKMVLLTQCVLDARRIEDVAMPAR